MQTYRRFEFAQRLFGQRDQALDVGYHVAAGDVAETDVVGVRACRDVERLAVVDRRDGYISSICAPFQYISVDGPGALEIGTLHYRARPRQLGHRERLAASLSPLAQGTSAHGLGTNAS